MLPVGRLRGHGQEPLPTSRNPQAARRAVQGSKSFHYIPHRFAELAALIDPGKEPKTDKPSILADAIKYVQQMRVENHQLKQLNKFLEERMAQLERERGQQLYQHSLMVQHGAMMPGMPGVVPPGLMPPGGCQAHAL